MVGVKMIYSKYLPFYCILGKQGENMKIKSMTIDNICGIKHLDLTFNSGLNLICGENGVGKTTVLKAITHRFLYGGDSFIKKTYGSKEGNVEITFNNDLKFSYIITDFNPYDIDYYSNCEYENGKNILYFSPMRQITYTKIDALNKIPSETPQLHSAQSLAHGVDPNIKSWIINRILFSNLKDSLTDVQQRNLDLCLSIFTLLDPDLRYYTAKPDYEILLTQKDKQIYLEMLSDGYKSCLYILLGIIQEVESRFPQKYVSDFDGVFLIDEIDLHLHPQWQTKLVNLLKEIFPKVQIIATTHSPSVLQTAKKEELIPLYKDSNGNVCIKELQLGEYGLQGWTLEEIMQDVMGMPSTNSELYLNVIKAFDDAMNNEDQEDILKNYEILKKMLHPQNPLLQLLEIQVAEWKN